MSKFYITTPIYYVNAEPHIGHTYTTIAADVLARYHRMMGDRIFFLTGTDEHGAKIEEKALEAKKQPQAFVDEITAKFQFAWDELNISNDNFIRTTNQKHKKAVKKALERMHEKGDIYKGEYEGLYCRGCEQYKSESDLLDGLCPDHKTKPEVMREECYMFKLSKYQDKLKKLIEKDEFKILPAEKKNEILSFYKEEIKDVSFSRKNVKWGIPLPWDKSQTTYVWADAFLNYLTGLGWTGDEKIPEMWPADVQLMSKDILRVHATIWPAMLMSLGMDLPKQIFVHGFFLVDGQKMSKSLGNVIAPADLIKKYGVDGTRYLLMSPTTFGHDGDISWEKFDEKYNADLANGIGNLVARSLALTQKMIEAKINLKNEDKNFQFSIFNFQSSSNFQFSKSKDHWYYYNSSLENMEIDKAIEAINVLIRFLDNYITKNKPWVMIKENNEKVGVVMYNILELIRLLSFMLWPFMPETSEKIWQSLGLDPSEEMKKDFNEATEWGGLSTDADIKKGEILFPRLDN